MLLIYAKSINWLSSFCTNAHVLYFLSWYNGKVFIYSSYNIKIITKSGLLLTVTTKGPPESPRQVPTPPEPLVQMLDDWIMKGNDRPHTVFVIVFSLTKLRNWLVEIWPSEKKLFYSNLWAFISTFWKKKCSTVENNLLELVFILFLTRSCDRYI